MSAYKMSVKKISAYKIAAYKMDANKMAANKISAYKIAANKIDANKMVVNKMDANKIDANKMDANKMDANKMVVNKMNAYKIAANKMDANKIDANKIVVNKMNAYKIAANKMDANKIDANKMDANKMNANKMNAYKIAANKMAANKMAVNKIDANKMDANKMDANKMDAYKMDANKMAVNKMDAKKMVLVLICFFLACFVAPVAGHGRLMDPPARNSMWRFGFSNPINYNDNELYCGGKMVQWVRNGGKCGVCGDPWHGSRPHEAGGKYANNIITRTYQQGALVNMTVHLTANHQGWFEFRLCPISSRNRKVNQKCLDKYLLKGTDDQTTRFQVIRGKYNSFFNFTIKLPEDLVCDRCVLQWKYKTGNTWDKDVKSGLYCVGCGPQEEFYNCADVSIRPNTKTETKETKNKNRLNSKRLVESSTNMPNATHKRFNMAATSTLPTQRSTARKSVKNTWAKKNQSEFNKNRPDWFPAGNNDVNTGRRRAVKSSRNIKYGNATRKRKWMASTNNFIIQGHETKKTGTTKNRGDSPLDNIYFKTKGHLVTRKRENKSTSSTSGTPGTTKSIWQWWLRKISPSQERVTRQRTSSHSSNRTTLAKIGQTTISPCQSRKKQLQNKGQRVIYPVWSYTSGWWHQQSPQSSAKPLAHAWTIKPVLKCRSLISLSGGMDSWCFANCNANYCPPNICRCERDLRYVRLNTGSALSGKNGENLSGQFSSGKKNWARTDLLRVRPGGTSRDKTEFSSVKSSLYPRREPVKMLTCRAIGLYARRAHFDDWCYQNCIRKMCPAFICRCTGQRR